MPDRWEHLFGSGNVSNSQPFIMRFFNSQIQCSIAMLKGTTCFFAFNNKACIVYMHALLL